MNPNRNKIEFVLHATNAKIEDVKSQFDKGAKTLHEALLRIECNYADLPINYMDVAMTVTSMDGVPGFDNVQNVSEGVVIGKKYKISDGSGLASNKVVTVVSPREVKTGGDGVPLNVSGAYKRPDWTKEAAVRFEDGEIGLMFINRLEPVVERMMPTDYQAVRRWSGDDITDEEIDNVTGAYRRATGREISDDLHKLNVMMDVKRMDPNSEFEHETYQAMIDEWVDDTMNTLTHGDAKDREYADIEIVYAMALSATGGEGTFAQADVAPEVPGDNDASFAPKGVTEGIDKESLTPEGKEKLDDLLDDNFSMYDIHDWEYFASEIGVSNAVELMEYVMMNTRNDAALNDLKLMSEDDGPTLASIHKAYSEGKKFSRVRGRYLSEKYIRLNEAKVTEELQKNIEVYINETKQNVDVNDDASWNAFVDWSNKVTENDDVITNNVIIDNAIGELREAQDHLRSASQSARGAMRLLRNYGSISERIRGYILGHIEPLIDSESEWMTKSINIEEIIEDLEGYKEGHVEESVNEASNNKYYNIYKEVKSLQKKINDLVVDDNNPETSTNRMSFANLNNALNTWLMDIGPRIKGEKPVEVQPPAEEGEDAANEHHLETRDAKTEYLLSNTGITADELNAMTDLEIDAAYFNTENAKKPLGADEPSDTDARTNVIDNDAGVGAQQRRRKLFNQSNHD